MLDLSFFVDCTTANHLKNFYFYCVTNRDFDIRLNLHRVMCKYGSPCLPSLVFGEMRNCNYLRYSYQSRAPNDDTDLLGSDERIGS